MAWARIDDGFDDHPKILALLEEEQGPAAVGLWTLCLTWAHRNTRRHGKVPGLIPSGLPRRYIGAMGKDLAKLLVAHHLWDELEDGWQIHDFVKYLPTDETKQARSEAGKRGAEKRWAAKRAAEAAAELEGDKQTDGKLPSGSHDDASNGEATDGSRAPAHRVIPNGITPTPTPIPEPEKLPVPSEPGAAEPRTEAESAPKSKPGRKPRAPTQNAGDVIAAYVDGAKEANQPRPSESLRGRVGRDARKLLDEGFALDDLVTAARNMGAAGWQDLSVQLQRDAAAAKARDSPPPGDYQPYANPTNADAYRQGGL